MRSAGADGADLVVCCAGQDCAGPCKDVRAHTDRPTAYEGKERDTSQLKLVRHN